MNDRSNGEPPLDDGIKIATLGRGPNRELRLRWREYKGHHFLDIREWSVNGSNTQWWPEKGKGITIKARELDDVAAAIAEAITVAHESGAVQSNRGSRG